MVLINMGSIFRRKIFWAGFLPAQFVLFFTFSKIEYFIDLFSEFFEFQKDFHQRIFALFPFSVGDIFYILLVLVILFFTYKIFRRKSRSTFILKFLILLNVLYFCYQIFWGMLYFQKPIIEYLPKGKISRQETRALTLKFLSLCRGSRELVKEDQNGVFNIIDLQNVKMEILLNQNALPKFGSEKRGVKKDVFKPSLFEGVMSYSGILGYYNPFTAEAQYNAQLPSTYLPFTLAHESMHQLGFAREQEANFMAYLIGRNSKNIDIKYSTDYFVLKSLLNYQAEKDPQFVIAVIQNYSLGMARDRAAEKKFVKDHEGLLDIFFGVSNDLFLKSNQQEGTVTYSYFINLLIRYERTVSIK